MSEIKQPERAVRLTLDLQADNREAVLGALRHIGFLILSGRMSTGVSGGYDSGYTYTYKESDTPTHDEYATQLEQYLQHLKTVNQS